MNRKLKGFLNKTQVTCNYEGCELQKKPIAYEDLKEHVK